MSTTQPRICAIVVTLNPILEDFARLTAALDGQVQNIIIVDNGSQSYCHAALRGFVHGSAHRHLIEQGENRGIANAQNRGIGLALALHCSHVLLLDQDSIPAADMVRQLLTVEHALAADNIEPGAIGPTPVDRRTATRSLFIRRQGWFIRRCRPGRGTGWIETDFLISSGTLISVKALRDIGLMDDGYFIDHVDTEWCFRAVRRGYRLFGAANALLHHRIGDKVMKIWFLRWREVPRHPPVRSYYICRNTLHMVSHAPMCALWRCLHFYRLLRFLALILATGTPRREHCGMLLRGLKDGLKGVQGMINAPGR